MNEKLENIIIDSDGDPKVFKGLVRSELGLKDKISIIKWIIKGEI